MGAGPAGVSAGMFLSEKGFDKIKIFEQNLNKRKPCGGGLTWRAVERYGKTLLKDLDLLPHKTLLLDIDGKAYRYHFPKPCVYTADRLILNKHLVELAESKGITIINKRVEPENLNEKLIIDARGFEPQNNKILAMVAICELKKFELTAILRSKILPEGYFWVFPINDKLANVGVGGKPNRKMQLGKLFNWFIKKIKSKPKTIMGGQISCTNKVRKNLVENFYGKTIIKVGERARIVNPLTGEGIYYAFRSSEILAECLENENIKSYETKIKKSFNKEFFWCKLLAEKHRFLPAAIRFKAINFILKKIFPYEKIEGLSSSLV